MTGRMSPRPVRRKRRKVVINLSNCRYPVLEEAAMALNWVVTRDDKAEWDLFWTDTSVSEERVLKLKKTQRINHFAGMHNLARKTGMARLLRRVGSHIPSAFEFMPPTWILPNEGSDLKKKSKSEPKWVIVKPDGSCQGKGIFLTNNAEKACAFSPAAVAQQYVSSPFLIDGFKFDIRIYVLVTSCDPLRIYLYEEGLARFCTKSYTAPSDDNANQINMHLTNYAINKKQENFTCSEDGRSGFKRKLTSVWQWLDEHGHSSSAVINSIARLSVATILAAQPVLLNTARSLNITSRDDRGLASFELLGLDVLLDENLKPWLLEVNHSPSFACESDMDKRIKYQLLVDTLSIVHVSTRHSRWLKVKNKSEAAMRLNGAPPRRAPANEGEKIRHLRIQHEERNPGLFTRIYPAPLGTPEADLYRDIEAASRRAHEEGEAKPPAEVKSPTPSTDTMRPSEWRSRGAVLHCSGAASSPTTPPLSPLPSSIVVACSGHHSFKYAGASAGARRRSTGSSVLSLSVGAASRFRARDDLSSGPVSRRKGHVNDGMDDDGGEEEAADRRSSACSERTGMEGGGAGVSLLSLRSRLKSSPGWSRVGAAWGAGSEEGGRHGAGVETKGKGLRSLGSNSYPFVGEGWADGLPAVARKVKLRRVNGATGHIDIDWI